MRVIVTALFLLALVGCDLPKETPPADSAQSPAPQPAKEAPPGDTPPKATTEPPSPPLTAPIPRERWDLDYAEKTWGLKVKQFDFIDESTSDYKIHKYRFLMEFSKEFTDEEMKAFKSEFVLQYPDKLHLAYIDMDNVVVCQASWSPEFKGSLTGLKDDAFWVTLRDFITTSTSSDRLDPDRVKRVELRRSRK